MLRRINAVCTAAVFVLFLIHGIAGGMQMAGFMSGGGLLQGAAYLLIAFVAVHCVIGIKLTIDSVRASGKAGVFYAGKNRRFIAVRLSGFVIMILMLFHMAVFLGTSEEGTFYLNPFGMPQLILHLLLVFAIIIHVLCNVKPFLISIGSTRLRDYIFDILIVLSVILLFMGAMFVVYYLRWVRV